MFGLTQGAANVAGRRFQRLVQRAFHVDLHQEMHAAAQVETEIHRQRAEIGQPLRRTRQQVQCHHVVLAQLRVQHVLGLELRIRIGEARLDAGRILRQHLGSQLRGLQHIVNACQQRRIRLEAGTQRQYLHGRRFAVEIGQCIDKAQHQRAQDQQVFPQRITVHCGTLNSVNLRDT